jgi:hypothetical protein
MNDDKRHAGLRQESTKYCLRRYNPANGHADINHWAHYCHRLEPRLNLSQLFATLHGVFTIRPEPRGMQ